MPDSKYRYPGSDVLTNKLNITNREEVWLFEGKKLAEHKKESNSH